MATKKSAAKRAAAPQVLSATEGESTILSTPEIPESVRLSVEPVSNGRWSVRRVGETNPLLMAVSAGYESQEEAIAAATRLLQTGRVTAPKSEPRSIWRDDAGDWQIITARELWPLAPGVVLFDLRWVGADAAPDGDALFVSEWELSDRATKALAKSVFAGAQPRVSIVRRKLVPTLIAMKIRLEHGKLAL